MREDNWEIYLGSRGFIWVDHSTQSASTPGQDPEDFNREIHNGGIVSQLKRQHRYWTYVQSHPNHVPQPHLKTAWQQAHDALVWCHAERVLFQQTNATFSREDSRELLEILTRLKDVDLGSSERSSAYRKTPSSFALRTWFMAAVLRQIAHDRLCTHHGQPDAPQHRQREADDMHAEREEFGFRIGLLYYVVGTAMFLGIPHSYHRRILSVDKTDTGYGVNSMRWKAFLGSMLKEWTDSNLLATVLISATVGFLAIPGIEDNSRIMGLFAVLLAIGSVLIAPIHVTRSQR
ncbi:hypothetical protein AURDEDRAFT_168769 [Auricularia subglabra TFB-10046 SS5]|nr:hypothetical protein AURDEDRAFT_168769 [Auricularia subglabra TFB-10046 SS5]